MKIKLLLLSFIFLASGSYLFAQDCVDCHTKITPNIVTDWQLSEHSSNGVDCAVCHGDKGQGNNDTFFPRLQGQHHAYLLRQSQWIRDGFRKNSNEAMLQQVKTMTDEELDAVADYLSRL